MYNLVHRLGDFEQTFPTALFVSFLLRSGKRHSRYQHHDHIPNKCGQIPHNFLTITGQTQNFKFKSDFEAKDQTPLYCITVKCDLIPYVGPVCLITVMDPLKVKSH